MRVSAKTLLLPLAGLFALGLYLQKAASKYLNFLVAGVSMRLEGTTPVLQINVNVQNPSNRDFTITSVVADILSSGQKIGNVSSFQTVVIASNAETILPLYARLNSLAVVSDLVKIITQGFGNSQEIQLKGVVNANGFVSPIDLKYKVL